MHRSARAAGSSGDSSVPTFGANRSPGDGLGDRNLREEQDDQMTSLLGNKISGLKSLTIEIGNEVRRQNRLLGDMDADMESSTGFLGNAMVHLKRIQRAGYSSVTWKLLAFAVLFFLVLFLVIKFR